MKIPKRFKLMGRVINVDYDKKLIHEDDRRGASVFRENRVKLQSSSKEYPIVKSDLEQSFLHELVHWILYLSEEHKLNHNEKFVEMFSGLLHQALITMEYDNEKK